MQVIAHTHTQTHTHVDFPSPSTPPLQTSPPFTYLTTSHKIMPHHPFTTPLAYLQYYLSSTATRPTHHLDVQHPPPSPISLQPLQPNIPKSLKSKTKTPPHTYNPPPPSTSNLISERASTCASTPLAPPPSRPKTPLLQLHEPRRARNMGYNSTLPPPPFNPPLSPFLPHPLLSSFSSQQLTDLHQGEEKTQSYCTSSGRLKERRLSREEVARLQRRFFDERCGIGIFGGACGLMGREIKRRGG